VAVPGIAISVSATSGSGSPLSGTSGCSTVTDPTPGTVACRSGFFLPPRVRAGPRCRLPCRRRGPSYPSRACHSCPHRCDAVAWVVVPGSRGSEDSSCRSSTRAVTPSALVGVAASIERKGTPSAPRTASHTAAPTAASTIRSRARGRQAGRAEQLLLGRCRRPVDLSGGRDGVRAFHGAPRFEALGEYLVKCRY
jgi:hypothetical protein